MRHTLAAADPALCGAARSLDRSLFAGIAWTAVFKWTAQAASWAATLYAARRLGPSAYGLVGMAMLPIGFARLVEDLGLDSVIVQDLTLSPSQLSSLAGAAALLGCTLTAVFAFSAGAIARYFRQPALVPLIIVLSVTFIGDA